MESLARLIVVMFLLIQLIAITSILTICLGFNAFGFMFALVSTLIALTVTKFRFESFLFWLLPIFALLFSLWKCFYANF